MERSALARHLVDEAQLRRQLEREYLPSGIPEFDSALGGIVRGGVTELWGPATSGKTTFLHCLLAQATSRGEHCALIDAGDTFDPLSAIHTGADLKRLLWVRCQTVEQALKATDLIVHSGGWGVVAADFTSLASRQVRRIPMSWWYRFRRAVEHTPTAFLVIETEPYVRNCATTGLEFLPAKPVWSGAHRDFRVLRGVAACVKPRKPPNKRAVNFEARAAV